MPLYKKLLTKLHYLEPDQIKQVYQAYRVASKYHSGQKRYTGEKYITHPVAVAAILAEMRIDYQTIAAALLHDLIEDSPITKQNLTDMFGPTIANLVDGITKLTQIESSNQHETQAQNFRKMVLAMANDIRVILIKLADRLHNMRTISSLHPLKCQRIARETLDIYAPIAHRLGMYQLYIELEELAFAALHPKRHRVLQYALKALATKHKEIIIILTEEINRSLILAQIEKSKISGRTKHLYGIYKKMRSHHSSFNNVMDIYGIRLVVPKVSDCYIVLGVIHDLYKPIPGKFKDYIALPKFNGYQSLHTLVFGPYGAPVEIQIRTQLMEQTANHGIAAHWLYKTEDKTVNSTSSRAKKWLNHLLEIQHHTSSSLEFFEHAKLELFPDKIYVFTPKGNIMELARGATVVDFAYAIHTDVGNSCVAVEINRKFLPLSTPLTSGQVVSIITDKNAEPNPEWLAFVITSKARSSIRHYLKTKKRSDLIILGKRLLEKIFTDIKFDLKKIKPEAMQNLLKNSGLATLEDLYEAIACGNSLATLVAYQLINKSSTRQSILPEGRGVKPLLLNGSEHAAINFANCCCPIPGDPIVGYLSAGYGLEVHVEDCVNLAKLRKQPEYCLPVGWDKTITSSFRVALNIEITNQLGSLAILTRAISDANAQIDDISTGARSSNYITISLYLLVKNLSHFERVKRHISELSSVIGVIRRKGN